MDQRPQQLMIEFDHRDDDGPTRVGPFTTRMAAVAHVERLGQIQAVWSVVPLAPPEHDLVTDAPQDRYLVITPDTPHPEPLAVIGPFPGPDAVRTWSDEHAATLHPGVPIIARHLPLTRPE